MSEPNYCRYSLKPIGHLGIQFEFKEHLQCVYFDLEHLVTWEFEQQFSICLRLSLLFLLSFLILSYTN